MSIDLGPSRRAREAVNYEGTPGAERLAQAAACLDPEYPLDELTRRAVDLTRGRFATPESETWRILLYAPLYLSSYCTNECVYCGFRAPEKIRRRHLTLDEAMREAEILQARGLRHLLLVAGDCPGRTTTEYFVEIIRMLVARGIDPAVEIAPQTTQSYARLAGAGACGVTLYQETYNRALYATYHPGGRKASYDWRLEGPRRAAEGGLRRLGLGILLGLADPREDLLAMIRHACYLRERFPRHTLAFSLPRIHRAPDGFQTPCPVDEETFVRLYCTLRVAFPDAELVLSTRESQSLRNRLAGICITQMSAGSCTVPGGYEHRDENQDGEQFPVDDRRTPAEMSEWLKSQGFAVAWSVGVGE